MAIFFTSDTHFGDLRVLRFDHRPFRTLAEHDDALITNWNDTVGHDDEVWFLGDFALGPTPERRSDILDGLHGTKHLIIGNNDDQATLALPGWASVQHYAELESDGRRLVICHYPFRTWNGIGKGVVNLHGHSHGRLTPIPRQYDVGVDPMGFRPAEIETILARRRRRAATSRKAG